MPDGRRVDLSTKGAASGKFYGNTKTAFTSAYGCHSPEIRNAGTFFANGGANATETWKTEARLTMEAMKDVQQEEAACAVRDSRSPSPRNH